MCSYIRVIAINNEIIHNLWYKDALFHISLLFLLSRHHCANFLCKKEQWAAMVTKYQNIALHQLILFVLFPLLSKNIYMLSGPRIFLL